MNREMSEGRSLERTDGRVRAGGPVADHAGADGAAVLSRSSAAAMRRLLNAFREGWVLDGRVHEAARLIAEDAHRAGIGAAHMIIAIRSAWATLDELRRVIPNDDARDLASRLVTCAIEEFYQPPASRGREDHRAD